MSVFTVQVNSFVPSGSLLFGIQDDATNVSKDFTHALAFSKSTSTELGTPVSCQTKVSPS